MTIRGLISEMDANVLNKTINLVVKEFDDEEICITEIGLYNCDTSRGIVDCLPDDRLHKYIGIDNEKDKKVNFPPWMDAIIGDSTEVYHKLPDNSQHLIFVDGDHSFAGVVADFFCYAPKVKVGGYIAFHDTGKHIKPFKDFQHGDKSNPDAYISVRKSLNSIGLFRDAGYDLFADGTVSPRYLGAHGFRLIFDEADENNEAGGICVFKKISNAY